MKPTYAVYTWDCESQDWERHRKAVRKWTLRKILRRLYLVGWSNLSVLVERNYTQAEKREMWREVEQAIENSKPGLLK